MSNIHEKICSFIILGGCKSTQNISIYDFKSNVFEMSTIKCPMDEYDIDKYYGIIMCDGYRDEL